MATAPLTIVVKAYDNVTNVTYNRIESNSRRTVYRQDTGNTFPLSARPVLIVTPTLSPSGIAHVGVEYKYPGRYTDTTKGLVITQNEAIRFKNGAFHVPQTMDPSFIQQASAQFLNLMNSPEIRAAFLDQTFGA